MADSRTPDNVCPRCGKAAEALTGLGVSCRFPETDVPRLMALLTGQLDNLRCDTCSHFLGVSPTIVVDVSEPKSVLIAVGTRPKTQREACLRQVTAGEQRSGKVESFDSNDALRAEIRKRLAPRLNAVNDILNASIQGELPAYVISRWRHLAPQVFAAAELLLAGAIPGAKLNAEFTDGSSAGADDVMPEIGNAQALSWVYLCVAWVEGTDRGATLEDDLEKYIDPGVQLPGALESFLRMFESLAPHWQASLHARFCAEAVRASIYAAAKSPNPQAGMWAGAFFDQELVCRVNGEATPEWFRALTVSERRARATITYRAAWDQYISRYQEPNPTWLRALHDDVAKAGHPQIPGDVARSRRLDSGADLSVKDWIDLLRSAMEKADSVLRGSPDLEPFSAEGLLTISAPFVHLLMKERRLDDLENLGDAILEMVGGSQTARAEVDAWLGSCLKTLRLPGRFLDRVGVSPRPWEASLAPELLARLCTERANALRLLGRADVALDLSWKILDILKNTADTDKVRVAVLNLAILLRETGQPDTAIGLLESLTGEVGEEGRLDVLRSLATTYSQLGRHTDALKAYDQAILLAVGPRADTAPLLLASRAGALSQLRRFEEAIADLMTLGPYAGGDPLPLLTAASVWVSIQFTGVEIPQAAVEWLRSLFGDLGRIAAEARDHGDTQVYLDALRSTAEYLENTDDAKARQVWMALHQARLDLDLPPDPVAAASLARHCYDAGDRAEAVAYLGLVPRGVAAQVGGLADVSVGIHGLGRLEATLDDVIRSVLESADGPTRTRDARLLAELSRDVLSRAKTLRRGAPNQVEIATLADGLSEAVLGRLAPSTGRVAVLEWIDDSERVRALLTCIDSEAKVSSRWLDEPCVELARLAREIRNKLCNWRSSRPGDPFDLPEWLQLERWLVAAVSLELSPGDHLVFFVHRDHAGLPWHVACGRHWSSSYAAGWTSLLASPGPPEPGWPSAVGIALVPRFGESQAVLNALRSSASRTSDFARRKGLPCLTLPEGAGDRDAVLAMIEKVDLAKFLCHGYVSPVDGELALMLAHGGALPLADSVSSGRETARAHRLSWRECQHLGAAPRLVVSAACSTGRSHVAGMGERLGLFGALRHAGTSAIVAPQWDMNAEVVLPILDEAIERYLNGKCSLASAVHSACIAAANDRPRRHAWALSIEGDWR